MHAIILIACLLCTCAASPFISLSLDTEETTPQQDLERVSGVDAEVNGGGSSRHHIPNMFSWSIRDSIDESQSPPQQPQQQQPQPQQSEQQKQYHVPVPQVTNQTTQQHNTSPHHHILKSMEEDEDEVVPVAVIAHAALTSHNAVMSTPGLISDLHRVYHLTGESSSDETQTKTITTSPSFGPTSGGVWIQVVGAGSFHTPNSLQCKMDLVEQFCYSNHFFYSWCYLTPKCSGVYPLSCHNGPMKFETKFAVVAKVPWATSVYPFSGDIAGGTPVTVRGWNFEPHCPHQLLCKFGNQIVRAKYYTSSSIMCISPCGTEKGFVSVEVSNDGGHHWSMSGVQFGYVGDEIPSIEMSQCQRYLSLEQLPHEWDTLLPSTTIHSNSQPIK